jgi:hypothetical protein
MYRATSPSWQPFHRPLQCPNCSASSLESIFRGVGTALATTRWNIQVDHTSPLCRCETLQKPILAHSTQLLPSLAFTPLQLSFCSFTVHDRLAAPQGPSIFCFPLAISGLTAPAPACGFAFGPRRLRPEPHPDSPPLASGEIRVRQHLEDSPFAVAPTIRNPEKDESNNFKPASPYSRPLCALLTLCGPE